MQLKKMMRKKRHKSALEKQERGFTKFKALNNYDSQLKDLKRKGIIS